MDIDYQSHGVEFYQVCDIKLCISNYLNQVLNKYNFLIILLYVSFLHYIEGRFGEVNPSGIMFYNKILDTLLLKGMVNMNPKRILIIIF